MLYKFILLYLFIVLCTVKHGYTQDTEKEGLYSGKWSLAQIQDTTTSKRIPLVSKVSINLDGDDEDPNKYALSFKVVNTHRGSLLITNMSTADGDEFDTVAMDGRFASTRMLGPQEEMDFETKIMGLFRNITQMKWLDEEGGQLYMKSDDKELLLVKETPAYIPSYLGEWNLTGIRDTNTNTATDVSLVSDVLVTLGAQSGAEGSPNKFVVSFKVVNTHFGSLFITKDPDTDDSLDTVAVDGSFASTLMMGTPELMAFENKILDLFENVTQMGQLGDDSGKLIMKSGVKELTLARVDS